MINSLPHKEFRFNLDRNDLGRLLGAFFIVDHATDTCVFVVAEFDATST